MDLKVGDVVEFKKYEDMTGDERMMIDKEFFPLYGKVKAINANGCDRFFNIEEKAYNFCTGSVARVIDDVDINKLNEGDEVLAKVTVKKVFNGFIQIESSVADRNVVKVLKHKEPERFIIQEDYYGMYVHDLGVFTSNKEDAKIYSSSDEANERAKEMPLNSWKVIHV